MNSGIIGLAVNVNYSPLLSKGSLRAFFCKAVQPHQKDSRKTARRVFNGLNHFYLILSRLRRGSKPAVWCYFFD
jgi:hypothetical protein